jgi:hypothetical protein
MTVKELIEKLQKMEPEKTIMIMDGLGGGGCPRTISFGPLHRTICEQDEDECLDYECQAGKEVVVMGFGV